MKISLVVLLITLLNHFNATVIMSGLASIALFLVLIGLVIGLNFVVPDTPGKMVLKHLMMLMITHLN